MSQTGFGSGSVSSSAFQRSISATTRRARSLRTADKRSSSRRKAKSTAFCPRLAASSRRSCSIAGESSIVSVMCVPTSFEWRGVPFAVARLAAAIGTEGVGFEPTEACASPVFKTGSLNHSDTPPRPFRPGSEFKVPSSGFAARNVSRPPLGEGRTAGGPLRVTAAACRWEQLGTRNPEL